MERIGVRPSQVGAERLEKPRMGEQFILDRIGQRF